MIDKIIKTVLFGCRNLAVILFGREFAYSLRYYHRRGHWPNLKNPKDLSEILISRILNNDFEKYARFVDKKVVRNFIIEQGLGDHLLKHFYYWDDVSDIELGTLPAKFVLKLSNGAGGKNIFVCRDKNSFNLDYAKSQLRDALNKKYKYEKQYNVYKPYIICEELIDTGSEAWPTDYKFTCIHGQPIDIFVGTEREKSVKFCTFDLNWNLLPNTIHSYMPNILPPRPKHLDEMIIIAKTLSKSFDFVRVDLYEYKDKVYFGELTFSPWGGLMYSYTDEAIKEYGDKLLHKSS